jgi:hypothetical protein
LEIRRLHIKTSNKVSMLDEVYHIPILNANRALFYSYPQCSKRWDSAGKGR